MRSTTLALTCLLALGLALPSLAAEPQPTQTCLYAFSKDMCGSRLFGGTWGIPQCESGSANCHNLIGIGATFSGGLAPSNGTCGPDPKSQVPCDEAPGFGGELIATVDVRAQRHTACVARGSYDGPLRLIDQDTGQTLATGELVATLGMGTHRRACDGSCSTDRECETCHDARVIDFQFNYEIASEGTLRGKVIAGPYAGCSFTASYQGDFIADGDSRGPQTPNATWGFCGTLEGVLECPCNCPSLN